MNREFKIQKLQPTHNTTRISRQYLFMEMVKLLSLRSNCPRKQVGCILVKDNRVIAMSYNGVLPGIDPKEGIDEEGNSKTVHAEINLIAYCAKQGIATEGCILYITLSPCVKCAEAIIQAGITTVYYLEDYRDPSGEELLNKFITVCRLVLE